MSTSDKTRSAVCFLVINRIEKLPELAIQSVLNHSQQNVVIGYISESDIQHLPKNERISYLDLSNESNRLGILSGNGQYQTFDQDSFFSLVRLKWVMLESLILSNRFSYLIYNDVDVFWIQDPSNLVENSFREMKHVDILIQNFTINPSRPNLCMGFVAIRSSESSLKLIQSCAQIHNRMLQLNPRTGDDDVISKYYVDSSYPNSILQLPQGLFPVGNFANLFSRKNLFPGLAPYKPYIFHSNFVVGMRKKIQLSYLMLDKLSGVTNTSGIQMVIMKNELILRRFYLFIRAAARRVLVR